MLNEQEIYRKAVELWGVGFQMDMMIEEMSELTHVICKLRRNQASVESVIEEMVDVSIMLEQMKHIFDKDGIMFYRVHASRLDRLEKLVQGGKP